MNEFEYKKELLISSIYDIFDSIDLLKSLLELQNSSNKKRYLNFIDKADSELNNLVYKLKYETEEPEVEDINNSEYTVTIEEKELTEKEIKKIIKDIKEFYNNRE